MMFQTSKLVTNGLNLFGIVHRMNEGYQACHGRFGACLERKLESCKAGFKSLLKISHQILRGANYVSNEVRIPKILEQNDG